MKIKNPDVILKALIPKPNINFRQIETVLYPYWKYYTLYNGVLYNGTLYNGVLLQFLFYIFKISAV